MSSIDFNFLKFTFFNMMDVVLVAIIVYHIYNLIRGTIAASIAIGLGLICILYFIVKVLEMRLLTAIIGTFMNVGIIALIVVFQQEIRRFLLLVGKNASFHRKNRDKGWWKHFFSKSSAVGLHKVTSIRPIVEACKSMQHKGIGALIVITKHYEEQFSEMNSCELIDAHISQRLLESIFHKNGPLHDGAVVIAHHRIKSASCILPLTDKVDLPPQMGLRHRAGIGISEVSDAVAVILSEETGALSYAKEGNIQLNIGLAELEERLCQDFN